MVLELVSGFGLEAVGSLTPAYEFGFSQYPAFPEVTSENGVQVLAGASHVVEEHEVIDIGLGLDTFFCVCSQEFYSGWFIKGLLDFFKYSCFFFEAMEGCFGMGL